MTTVSAHLTQGLDIFDATTMTSLLRSRYAGSGVFTALNLNATRLQELGEGFEGALSASGQLASRALLTSQECGYGGSVFGRGFDDSEMVGDVCALGSAELRYNAGFADKLNARNDCNSTALRTPVTRSSHGILVAGRNAQRSRRLPPA